MLRERRVARYRGGARPWKRYGYRLAEAGPTVVASNVLRIVPHSATQSRTRSGTTSLTAGGWTNISARRSASRNERYHSSTMVVRFPRSTVIATLDGGIDRVLAINVGGVINCCRATIPTMISQARGKVMNVASPTAHVALPRRSL